MRHHLRHMGPAVEPLPEVWTGRATNRLQWVLAAAGAACIALGIKLAVSADWETGITALLMAVIGCVAAGLLVLYGTLAFVHLEVTIDREALEVRCGHVGLPRKRILLSEVVKADYDPKVTPHQWGGWGCRWRPEKGTAWVVRRGEGVVVTLAGGDTFTVTVDNAATAVRVIRDRLSRSNSDPVPHA
ncbi:hypothetical protein HW130_05530 [Streptomyces sp. PKU-EA00015]|uniref:hypothetical protein n=1 Tax=Streptomyces sp. PKU-EA00015 TaxID=2748326 RepID=UPI0015A210F7|nr:hypothetical protein [Streptomyces sp. PKU-EA00015]NWF25730.1 hypothetical protein [Streptomyces sp. PKU-EA00015]